MSDFETLLMRIDNLLNENSALRMENERLMRDSWRDREVIEGLHFLVNDLKNDLRKKS